LDKKVEDTILKFTKRKKHIIHGARAINKHLPEHLQRPTYDYDLWAKKPRQAMDKLEDKLDEAYGGDYFYEETIPLADDPRVMVYRVISRIDGKEVADFIKTPKGKKLYKVIGGVRWETLNHAKKAYKKILSNPENMHRWAKAQDDLRRIERFERELQKKRDIREDTIPFSSVFVKPIMVR